LCGVQCASLRMPPSLKTSMKHKHDHETKQPRFPSIVNYPVLSSRMRSRTCNCRSHFCTSLNLFGITNWRMNCVSSYATPAKQYEIPIYVQSQQPIKTYIGGYKLATKSICNHNRSVVHDSEAIALINSSWHLFLKLNFFCVKWHLRPL
jgi:hypothetical protein